MRRQRDRGVDSGCGGARARSIAPIERGRMQVCNGACRLGSMSKLSTTQPSAIARWRWKAVRVRDDHAAARNGGGARIDCPRANSSTTRMAAPQCGQTKVAEAVVVEACCVDGCRNGERHLQQLTRSSQVLAGGRRWRAGRSGGCDESRGQDMQQEAAHELLGAERHRLVARLALGAVVLPAEGDAALVECEQAAVGDGHAVRVAGQIGEHRRGSGERALGIDDPLARAQRCEPVCEGLASARAACSPKNCNRPARWACSSSSRKRRRNSRDSTRTGRKKPGRQRIQRSPSMARPPPGTMPCTCGMVRQRRAPGVQHQRHAHARRPGAWGRRRSCAASRRRHRTADRRSPPCWCRRWRRSAPAA